MLGVRVFRVIGGICSLLILSNRYSDPRINKYVGLLILFIGMSHFIYIMVLTGIKMYNRRVLWKKDTLRLEISREILLGVMQHT